MASNALPRNTGALSKLALNMASGLTSLGTALGISQVTAAQLDAQVGAMNTAESDFNVARLAMTDATTAATLASEAIAAWLSKARAVLVPYLGEAWSAQWAAAGFTNVSTAVPGTVGERFKLIGLLEPFFTANPSYQNDAPKVKVTAVEAKRLKDASTAAAQAVTTADAAAKSKKTARETAIEELRGTMRVLIGILDDKLTPDDSRWADFGLNLPAADTTPAAPIGLTATVVDGPAILCQCDAVEKATRYRWRMRPLGAPEYVLATSTTGPLAHIGNVALGQTVEIIVQAVNGSAQGLPSGAVPIAVPAARAVREAASSGAVENGASIAPKTTYPNGNRNGNGSSQPRLTPA